MRIESFIDQSIALFSKSLTTGGVRTHDLWVGIFVLEYVPSAGLGTLG
jgi:hypothetical protein